MKPNTLSGAIAGMLATAIPVAAAGAGRSSPAEEFEELAMVVEQNATDGDTEVVISGVAGDDGLRLLTVHAPGGRKILALVAPDAATLGEREFHFESPEPPGEAVLAGYPEGDYLFTGISGAGVQFRGVATLSHDLPGQATILHPAQDSVIAAGELTILWSAVPGVREYVLEFENESADPEQVLTLNLPPDATSFEIPKALLVPGSSYQVGVQTVGDNGNIVAVEVTFSTAE